MKIFSEKQHDQCVLRRAIQRLAQWPSVFDGLRWVLEGGYRGHKTVIARELSGRQGLILDVGCGTGTFSPFFAPHAYLGVDLSPVYIGAASQKHVRHQFVVADARQLPFAEHCIATVMICGVLHHLTDEQTEQVLGEVSRILTTDGQLIVWEDIPSVAWWNFVGHLIHRFDLGSWIRHPDQYRALLNRHFTIVSKRLLRSGVMDYVVFACTPRSRAGAASTIA